MSDVRPDWTTHGRYGRRTALAARDGVCTHGREVLEHEPIGLLGTAVDQGPDGYRVVDLSGASWHPHQCLGAPQEASA